MPNTIINRRVVLGGVPLLPETQQWLAALSTRPNSLVVNAVNSFIKTCKADGNWTLLDRFWLLAQDVQTNARVSIINSTSTSITEVNSPTWTAMQGYDFNGTTQYLRTNYVPSVNGVNYTLNKATHGLYCIENVTSATFAWDMGAMDASNVSNLNVRDNGNVAYGKINNAIANLVSVASASALGLFSVKRTASNAMALFKNGASIATDTDVSTAVPTVEFYVGANNNNGAPASFSNRKMSIIYIGSSDISDSSFYTAVQTLATTLSFNV